MLLSLGAATVILWMVLADPMRARHRSQSHRGPSFRAAERPLDRQGANSRIEGAASDEEGASNADASVAETARDAVRWESIGSVSSDWSSLECKAFYVALLAGVCLAVANRLRRRAGQGFVATTHGTGVGL